MEDKITGLQQELDAVKNSRAGNEPGLVRLSSSQSVTDSTGLALPTSENNAAVAGTLANRIEKNKESFSWKLVCGDVSQTEIPDLWNHAGNEYFVLISDGYVVHSKICPKLRNVLRIEQTYNLAKCNWTFNLWKTSNQIEVWKMVDSRGNTIENSEAKITVYYR